MQIKKRNRRTARRSSRKSHSRKAYRKSHNRTAYRSRKAYRSTRRRMGGAHMTVYQPYTFDSPDNLPLAFDIEINPDIEKMYDNILHHRYNYHTEKMAPTFAAQQNGQGDFIVVFKDDSANIRPRNPSTQSAAAAAAATAASTTTPLEERLAALHHL